MKKSTILRKNLAQKKLLVKPSAFDALSAKIIETAGFKLVGVTGYGASISMLGKPDVGFITLTEMINLTRFITSAISIPVICDAEAGFGNAVNVFRTTEEFIKAGAAGFHMEDQVSPKRCGHVAGKQLVPIDEAVGKIRAANKVRNEMDPDFLIIARTDARGAVGGSLEETIRRGKAYIDAGADMIFPDGITSLEELSICIDKIKAPIHFNVALIGAPQTIDLTQLDCMGVAIASNPAGLLRVSIKAMWDYAHGFAKRGSDFMKEADESLKNHPTGNLHEFVGFSEIKRIEEEFLPKEEVDRKYTNSLGFQP